MLDLLVALPQHYKGLFPKLQQLPQVHHLVEILVGYSSDHILRWYVHSGSSGVDIHHLGFRLGSFFFPRRAGGGSVTAGQGYLVGERGPEWFRPQAKMAVLLIIRDLMSIIPRAMIR